MEELAKEFNSTTFYSATEGIKINRDNWNAIKDTA